MEEEGTIALKRGPARTVGRPPSMSYEEAFTEAYQTYYTKVFAYVYSRVGNVELSKDLVAEVFEKAYLKGHALREAAAYATWLFIIAKNVVIGYYRRRKREISGMDKMKESVWLSQRPPGPEEDALQDEMVTNLMRQVKKLSERDQQLLSLKFEGELSYAEISEVLKMSEVNVRVSLFRALKRLRVLMEEEAG